MSSAMEFLKDFQSGPLDRYRKLATFDWKKLMVFIAGEEELKYTYEIYEFLKKDPIFYPEVKELTLDEERQIAYKHLRGVNKVVKHEEASTYSRRFQAFYWALLNWNAMSTTRSTIHITLFTNCLRSLGTEKHRQYIRDAEDLRIIGCFSLTEVAHGSNTKGIQTVAKYDKESQQFVINTPDFLAAKCWIGNLGKTATHTCLYARLITPDNTDHGLHAFIVPIRDPKTMLPYPGVIIGDLGEKIGLRSLDNGFMLFKNYRIPRDNLLNKMNDVTPDGEYVHHMEETTNSSSEIFSVLMGGRVNVANLSTVYLVQSIVIAVRYCAARLQNGKDEEIPVLEYPTTQLRLMPYLAGSYISIIFGQYLTEQVDNLRSFKVKDQDVDTSLLFDLLKEVHAVSSAGKCFCSWLARDGIQECREACGGYGYLKAAQIGSVRDNNDANCTFEGDNHVLIQQTSNWLLKYWSRVTSGENINTPLKTIDFLNNYTTILKSSFNGLISGSQSKLDNVEDIFSIYRWLICWYSKITSAKLEQEQKLHDSFTARNNIQVYFAFPLSLAFAQYLMLQVFYEKIKSCTEIDLKQVLQKIFVIFGCFYLEKHTATLYQGGAVTKPEFVHCIRETISSYCALIKDEAVSLADAISPPDFILNSVIGHSDGQIYQHIERLLYTTPGTFERPHWWKEVLNFNPYCDNLSEFPAKL